MVNADHELILISEKGIVLRTPVAHISLQGRPTQGVKLMDVSEGDAVAAVTLVDLQRTFTESQPLPTGATAEGDPAVKKGKRRAAASKAAKPAKAATAKSGPKSAKAAKAEKAKEPRSTKGQKKGR
jgi:DNA gyrase/topoisomerase IV subunit A